MEKICLSSFPTPIFWWTNKGFAIILQYYSRCARAPLLKICWHRKPFRCIRPTPLFGNICGHYCQRGLYEAKPRSRLFWRRDPRFPLPIVNRNFVNHESVADDFVSNSPTQLKKYGQRQRCRKIGRTVSTRNVRTQEGSAIYGPMRTRLPTWNHPCKF